MDASYSEYIISKFSNFLDPFSLTEIKIERLCYPVTYASEDILKGWQANNRGKDLEDDLLVKESLLKDLPDFEKYFITQTYITDGAAHILRNKARENFVQLLGMPKIGKSTLLKKIALMAAQEMKQDPVSAAPLLINLETVMKNEISSKMEFIEACFAQYEEFEAYLREKFFQGKIILLLDELDKLGEMNLKVIEWIKALKTFVKLPLCVIASRQSGYLDLETVPVLVVDIYPMKLQISMAQNILSEFQFERFVEFITGKSYFYSEFASTPYLFSLLLEMFRWGIIGTEESITRGKLYSLAVTHLLGSYNSASHKQGFEVLATDLLMRDAKTFNFYDVKNLGVESLWQDLKSSKIIIVENEVAKVDPENSEDFRGESLEGESGIGEVKESLMLLTFKNLSRRDTTPQWTANTKESYLNYQIARKCIVRNSIGEFANEVYRFLHPRFIELLSAQNFLNQIEDSLLHSTAGFLMESSAFQKSFSICLPMNFLFCRRFREVLLFVASLCSENIFENLIKYLLNKETIEHCYIAEKLLRERGVQPNHRPLINKLKQDKQDLSRKAFTKSFFHPSPFVQKICKAEALDSGIPESELVTIINKNIDFVLKNTHWLYLKQIFSFGKDPNIKIIKALYTKLLETSLEILTAVTRPGNYKAIVHKVFLSLFLTAFEKSEVSHSNNSNFTPPVSNCSTPNKLDNDKNTEESTIRICFDKIKIPKNESATIEKIGSCAKLISVLIDLLQICPVIEISLCVRVLLTIGCSISQIHISLASRFACLEDKQERKDILRVLRMLGFVTQHTIDIPLVCLNLESDLKAIAKEILSLLNTEKLKKYAVNVLIKEDSPQIKILLSLRALGFTCKQGLDAEIVYFLVQFIDHYVLELRLEAIKSLHALVKKCKFIENPEIRKHLAVVPHVLKDRLKLPRYDPNLKSNSLKCLVALWTVLDKGKEDSNSTQMFHILVKEQIGTSYLVGSVTSILATIKEFVLKSSDERMAAWVCMRQISPIFEYLDFSDRTFFFTEMKVGLFQEHPCESKNILKLLVVNSVTHDEKSAFLSIILNSNFEKNKKLCRYISVLILNWHEILALKTLIPSTLQITSELCRVFSKIRVLIENLYNTIDSSNVSSFNELKHLHNWYKSLVNQVAENLQWPSKLFPHRNQLLDVSADPSFYMKEESVAEVSYTDLDCSFPKNSMDSANTDLDEQPPPLEICYQLLLAGVRSEGLKHWVLWYLKRSETINLLIVAAESWALISHNKDFYNPHVENLLNKFLITHPEEVVKIVIDIRFKSDNFCVKIVNHMIKGVLRNENCAKAVFACMELNSPIVLEEMHKMVTVTHTDPVHMHFLHSCVAKTFENINIINDTQVNSVLKALVSTGCSLFLQHIWNYWIKSISQRPSYVISSHTLSILENCNSWDCKFLLTRSKILGLLPVDQYQKETGSSMSTKKL